uniref:Uncharacterized protein n=1 Tax=Ascaris lumbricoides TaxID=6252 RepID=A0A0M3IK42_ASCLU
MAFYFALFNVSNVNVERPRRRYHRSSSPHRRPRQLPDEMSGALHDYRLLPRPRILGNHPPRPPTPPLPRNPSPAIQLLDVPGTATPPCLSSLHSGRCVAGKRVTFEEHSLQQTFTPNDHNVPFLDVREASMIEVNGNPTISSSTVVRARMDRQVFEKVALWAATGEVTMPRRRTMNTHQDGKLYYLLS